MVMPPVNNPNMKHSMRRSITRTKLHAASSVYLIGCALYSSFDSIDSVLSKHRLMLGDVHVPKGTYTLFVDISDPDQWTLIVNKKTGEWGLAHDASQDLGKTRMTMSKPPSMVENLKYTITDNGGGKGTITLAWEDKSASVPVTVHK